MYVAARAVQTELAQFLDDARARRLNVILSSESWPNEPRFVHVLSGFDVTAVVGYRVFFEWVVSNYAQRNDARNRNANVQSWTAPLLPQPYMRDANRQPTMTLDAWLTTEKTRRYMSRRSLEERIWFGVYWTRVRRRSPETP